MKLTLIIGGTGQLGSDLQFVLQNEPNLVVWNRPDYDISKPAIIQQITDLQPATVINAAAWTAVDAAEEHPNDAYAVNALGPKYIAEACNLCGACLVHISTNEVFSGESGRFYYEYDQTHPSSVYARSKFAGEKAAQLALKELYIVRVAWLYGPSKSNFPSKIIAAADRHGSLKVVNDEFGNPTHTVDVADAIKQLIQTERYGSYHLVNEGYCSRYEWAKFILKSTGRGHIPITPIPSAEWVRATTPPLHSVLVNHAAADLGIRLRHWKDAFTSYDESKDSI